MITSMAMTAAAIVAVISIKIFIKIWRSYYG